MKLADAFVNLDKCGPAFRQAIANLDAGLDVRRASWPAGMFLRLERTGLVGIYRDGKPSAPSWAGTEGHYETDWEVASDAGSPTNVTPADADVEDQQLRTMSAEEYRTFGDPKPGTDESWDTLTESEKNYFRTLRNNGGRDPLAGGKTLGDLFRDRAAIDVEAVQRQPQPQPLLPPTDTKDG